ncbi:hypothetical protein OT109_14240 [Phycisphaeraceae bacterium D3-23]
MDEQATNAADRATRRWLVAWLVFAGLLVVLTFLSRSWPEALGAALAPFDLGRESNIAAWFSASSLLWSGLLMWSSAALLLARDRWAAFAVFVLGGAAIALSVDEAGSLHERVDQIFPTSFDFYLKVFFAALTLPVLACAVVLFSRRKVLGHQWLLLLAAYGLFGSVFAQEMLEHAVDWPGWALPIRTVVEEGTELGGFFLLLLAGVRLLGRCRSARADGGEVAKCSNALPTRSALCSAFGVVAVVAPLLILRAVTIPIVELQLYKRGDFGSTMMLAMFLIAGTLCLGRASELPDDRPRRAWWWVAIFFFLFSLLQNWHVYSDASMLVLGREPELLWRACFDLVWALPIFIAMSVALRRRIGLRLWMAGGFVLLWVVCLFAMQRGSFRLSYASSYLTALVLGVWVIHATRRQRV